MPMSTALMPAMRIEATKAARKPVDLDMRHEPRRHEQRQAHEDDRQDAGDHDVRCGKTRKTMGRTSERDGAGDDGQQEGREQVDREVAVELDAGQERPPRG